MWNQTFRISACVGAFAAASDGVGIAPAPIGGITGAAAGVIGASGPFTQQHAGRSSSDSITVEIDVRIAIGFQGIWRRIRMSRSRKVPAVQKGLAGSALPLAHQHRQECLCHTRSPLHRELRKYGRINVAQTLLSVLVRLGTPEKSNAARCALRIRSKP